MSLEVIINKWHDEETKKKNVLHETRQLCWFFAQYQFTADPQKIAELKSLICETALYEWGENTEVSFMGDRVYVSKEGNIFWLDLKTDDIQLNILE